jgi:hypothetical protein
VVGFTTGSRGEAPGKREPVVRDDNINNNNNNNNKYADGLSVMYLCCKDMMFSAKMIQRLCHSRAGFLGAGMAGMEV